MKKRKRLHCLYLFAVLPIFFVGCAEAKTNLPADGYETGGGTITDVVVPSAPSPRTPTPAEVGKNYDISVRKGADLPLEWFACQATEDCGLVHVPCSTSLAVSKLHKDETQAAICGSIKAACYDVCAHSIPDTSLAICDNRQCSTIIMPYSAISKAKNIQPVDPGSGTGGVTVTGVTETTTYQYQAPVVTAINGIPTTGTSTIRFPADGSNGGKSYDAGYRKITHMPPEWFVCKTTDDCGLIPVLCGPSFAVSKIHKEEAHEAFCKVIGTCGPKASCIQSIPDMSMAMCDNGQCSTVFQPNNLPNK